MKLVFRLALVALAVPALFLVHLFGMFFIGAQLSRLGVYFEWPLLGAALFSFIAAITLVIAFIFRDKRP